MIQRKHIDFVSSAAGAFTESFVLDGTIVRVVTNPGSEAPTDDWDITLVDDAGLDLFRSQGANRDTTNSEQFCPGLACTDGTNITAIPVSCHGTVTLTIANAGAAKTGSIDIFYE